MQGQGITIPVPPGISTRAVLALLLASASNVQAATAALLRRATSEGLTVTEDEAKAAVRYVRQWGMSEMSKLADVPAVVANEERRA